MYARHNTDLLPNLLQQCESVRLVSESWSPQQALRWASDTYQPNVAIASGLGPEGIVIIDMAMEVSAALGVFTLDTGFLFPETLDLMEKVERRYGIRIERVLPALTPEEQSEQLGAKLWNRNPDQCCLIRKIQPLENKLENLHAWVTGIRREQTSVRRSSRRIEWDSKFERTKINPLVDWTEQMVWSYIRERHLDYNSLHDRNYPSIGCTHCTRAIVEGETHRAGRWAGYAKTECGLHGPKSVR
jgi:phosphoadenosine phosphosulfate reductase